MDYNTSCLYDFLYTPLSSRSTIPCCSHRLSMVNTLPFVTSKPLTLMEVSHTIVERKHLLVDSLSRIQLILQDGWLDKLYSLVISLCLSVPFSYSSLVSLVNPCSVMIFLITICGVNSLLPFDFLEWWRLLHPCFLARRCCQWPYKITHYLWILFSFSLFFGVKESGKGKFLVC